jgi:hypothetical protein
LAVAVSRGQKDTIGKLLELHCKYLTKFNHMKSKLHLPTAELGKAARRSCGASKHFFTN